MNSRKLSAVLAMLLVISTVLTGTLLVLYSEHECHDTVCPTCMMLERSAKLLLSCIALLGAAGLFAAMSGMRISGPPEDRFVPVWTPVRRKVKLLN